MAQKQRNAKLGAVDRFPPEADGEFDVVPDAQIAAWQQMMKDRFGIGTGKLKIIEDPKKPT